MGDLNTADLSNILSNTIENLLLAEQQIQEKEISPNPDEFQFEHFWQTIIVIAQKLSFECTKICIMFSQAPIPSSSETSSLLTALEQAVLSLVSCFYRFPLSQGETLHSYLQHAVVRAIQASRQLLKIIKDEGSHEVVSRYHQSTGVVWQGCAMIEKCPRDNKTAVLLKLNAQNILVGDAFDEISEALKGDGTSGMDGIGMGDLDDSDMEDEEEEEKWTDEDKEMINPSVNLIKASKILYKRIIGAIDKNGTFETTEKIKELDTVEEDCNPVSQTVDSLILEMYPPLSMDNMQEQSHLLATLISTALKTAAQSHIITENEQSHIEFLQKAVDHNLQKMEEKIGEKNKA
ncbi:unnamed protein product, partial [Meganyctiphanes norvegica]|uniref:Cyclin-D1-binding protein 1 n=1 Tax=Meganyctiphanes norvegica TaxID=48144 RepID=A0AAV2Q4G1_MEGNR